MMILPEVPTGTHSHKPTISPIPSILPDKPEYQQATKDGERTLWVVFVVMLIASVAFTGMSWRIPVSKRFYHVITTLITTIAALSYFAMSSGQGTAFHHIRVWTHNDHTPDTYHDIYRQVFFARYVDWALTTPLLILDLSVLAGLNGAHILLAIVSDVIMILAGLFAAFGTEGHGGKWGWYAIACIAYLSIVWQLAVNGHAVAKAKGSKVGKFYASIAGFTVIVWTAYPVVWAIADGSRILSLDQEIIIYAILDILAKPVFGAWLLVTHAYMQESNVELGGFWAHGFNREGLLRVGGEDDDGA